MIIALLWAALGAAAGFVVGRRVRAAEVDRAFWRGVRDTREAVMGAAGDHHTPAEN